MIKHIAIATFPDGLTVDLYHASRKTDCWPGWYSPLGRAGYWGGQHRNHLHYGREKTAIKDWANKMEHGGATVNWRTNI